PLAARAAGAAPCGLHRRVARCGNAGRVIVACNVDVQRGSEGWSERVRRVYDRVAGRYDLAALGFRLLGFRYDAYLRRTAEALAVRPGQTVVDLGCGTGKNLPALAEAVGPGGRVVGVDISVAMLERARARLARKGLRNVELVEADAATFGLPTGTERVLATFSLSMMPDPERVIEQSSVPFPRRVASPCSISASPRRGPARSARQPWASRPPSGRRGRWPSAASARCCAGTSPSTPTCPCTSARGTSVPERPVFGRRRADGARTGGRMVAVAAVRLRLPAICLSGYISQPVNPFRRLHHQRRQRLQSSP
ncbi:MAG: class I SAM-dependent methyltransferase, partial [Longimicrobiaceae bacterium]